MTFSLRSLFLLPFWFLQLFTGAKSFRDNGLLRSKRLNRFGLHSGRARISHELAWWRRRRLAKSISGDDRAQFDGQGYIQVENFLPPDDFLRLRDKIFVHEAPARDMVQGNTVTRRFAVDAGYEKAVPEILKLLRTPRWKGLMRYVSSFNVEPLYYIQVILPHRKNGPDDPQTALHSDTFHPTMKAWFFLHDVADDEGPFQYVPGSHRLTPKRIAWEKRKSLTDVGKLDRLSQKGSMRIEPRELAELSLPPPQRFAVPANTLVVADTCGFHGRCPSSKSARRVEIWAYSRRNPFLPWTGLDIFSLPGIASRRIGALWFARDKLRKYLGQPWRKGGKKTPMSD